MVNITLSVNEELKNKMEQFPEINWSGLIRRLLEEKTRQFELREQLRRALKKEEVFTKWSVDLGRKAKKGRFKKLMTELSNSKKKEI